MSGYKDAITGAPISDLEAGDVEELTDDLFEIVTPTRAAEMTRFAHATSGNNGRPCGCPTCAAARERAHLDGYAEGLAFHEQATDES